MRRKIICGILVLNIMFGTTFYSVMAGEGEKNKTGGELLKDMYFTEQTVAEDEGSIVNSAENEACMKSNYLSNVMEVSEEYSKSYGGSYIDENAELVVLLTDTSEEVISYCGEAIGTQGICYKKCEVSFEKLEELRNYIIDVCTVHADSENDELRKVVDSIVSIGIYVNENVVYIEMVDCNEEIVNLFREYIIDTDKIVFENTDGYNETSEYIVQPGERIHINKSNAYLTYSMGFRCRKLSSDGKYLYGFVTAAHGNSVSDKVFSSSGSYIGYVYARSCKNLGKTDAAFVYITNSKYKCDTIVYGYNYGQYISPGQYVTKCSEGATVYKAGCTTGLTSGTIKDTSAICKDTNGNWIYDVVKTTCEADHGDSGGTVYMIIDGDKCVAGILIGVTDKYSFYCKVTNIREDLGVKLY